VGEDHALAVFGAVAYHLEVLFKVQLEGPDGFFDVIGRFGDARQGQHHVAGRDLRFQPLVFLESVALMEGEAFPSLKGFQVAGGDVEAHDFPVGAVQHGFGQVRADKAVDTSDEYFHFCAMQSFHSFFLIKSGKRGRAPGNEKLTCREEVPFFASVFFF